MYQKAPADDERRHSAAEPVPEVREPSLGRPRFGIFDAIEGRAVSLEPTFAVVPMSCACCGEIASGTRAERRRDGGALLVPYCDECRRHAAATFTRTLSVSAASALLGTTLAAAVPLVWQRVPSTLFAAIVTVGAFLPLLAALYLRPLRRRGHVATGRAAFWLDGGELACASPKWASELARANGSVARSFAIREPLLSAWMLSGLFVAVVAAFGSYRFHHPLVRVLNLNEGRLDVWVDGKRVISVEPTTAESPYAGADVRIPAGIRLVEARDATGRTFARAELRVESGTRHLYAPGSDGYCFWIERTGYGRFASESTLEPLLGEQRFWVLPDPIDTWFASNPAPVAADDRSTGGILTALRQAPCRQAPPEVRPR